VDTKIKKLLDQNKIKYLILPHRKVYTAFNAAETQHINMKQVVKTVLIKLDKNLDSSFLESANLKSKILNLVLVCVPAGKRVELKKIAKTINELQEKTYKISLKNNPKIKKPVKISAKLSSEKDITSKLKTKVGLISPFGRIFGLPVLMDKKLAANNKLTVSAGSYTESIELAVKDYTRVANPIFGNFTE
jgi:Ala-tRNA(Pro) deacylase